MSNQSRCNYCRFGLNCQCRNDRGGLLGCSTAGMKHLYTLNAKTVTVQNTKEREDLLDDLGIIMYKPGSNSAEIGTPESQDLRINFLTTAVLPSGKTRYLHPIVFCMCHVAVADRINGQREGTITFRPGCRLLSPKQALQDITPIKVDPRLCHATPLAMNLAKEEETLLSRVVEVQEQNALQIIAHKLAIDEIESKFLESTQDKDAIIQHLRDDNERLRKQLVASQAADVSAKNRCITDTMRALIAASNHFELEAITAGVPFERNMHLIKKICEFADVRI